MRCSKAQRLISDYVDHLLGSRQIRELEDHLQKCQRCRAVMDEMLSIVNGAKHLEITPPAEDLWPAIRNQIEQKQKKAAMERPEKKPFFGFSIYPARLAYGTGALLAGILLVSLIYYGLPLIDGGGNSNNLSKNELAQLELAGRHYQTAIDDLDKAISDQKARLNPELAAVFEQNLKIIDDSIRACKAAMEDHRENRVANLHLLICYRKKVELLNEMKNTAM